MSLIPDTGYLITNSSGNQVDISTIFNSISDPNVTHSTAVDTSFNFFNGITQTVVDLSTVINALQLGDTPVSNTGYKVTISGVPTDLSQIFQPKILYGGDYYTILPSNYPIQEIKNGNDYYVSFPYYTTTATITFKHTINNINVIVVGGGGCGRSWSYYSGIIRSGGGGGGGGVADASFNVLIDASFNISIGKGGQIFSGGAVEDGLTTTFTSGLNNITCTGGQTGSNETAGNALGGFGTVSGSIFTTINAGTGGDGGKLLLNSDTPSIINNGGNSAITSLLLPPGPFPYGLGGGGGAGGNNGKGGTAGNGTGGIYGAASTGQGGTPYGFGCGGGGCAYTTSESNTNTIGNNGFVLIYFNTSI